MEHSVRTVITLDLSTTAADWPDVDEAVRALAQVAGVERVTIKHRLDRACWVAVEVALVGPDKASLRASCDHVTRVAMRPPLCLRGRQCVLSDLYG
jgi:hypothetical protein